MAVEFSPSEKKKKKGRVEEELGKSFSEFKKKYKAKYNSFVAEFKKKGFSKAGIDDLFFHLWKLEVIEGGYASRLFRRARRLLGKLTIKGFIGFLSLFKLAPSRFFKK